MKKIFIIALLAFAFLPNKLLASGNVAKIGTEEYTTMTLAVEAAQSGNTIEMLSNATANELTLKEGVTLVVSEGKTLTLTGKNVVEEGSTVRINGLIVVEDVLDTSKIGFGQTEGLIKGQDGKISIKSTGKVFMPNCWAGASSVLGVDWVPSGTYAQDLYATIESGASIAIADKTFVYENNAWKGAFEVGTNNYETFNEALTATTNGSTIKLLADAIIPYNTQLVGKNIVIDLNGYNLSAIKKVFYIQNSTVRFTGKGKISNIVNYDVVKPSTSDTSVMELVGSTVSTDKNYTNVYIGPDVTLEARVGIYIQYASRDLKASYGVNLEFEGTINAVNDSQNGTVYNGVGIQTNGTIQNTENYPIITVKDGAKIKSTGAGMYAAANGKYVINKANIEAVESGVAIKSGSLTLNGATIKVTGEDTTPTEGWSNGVNASGAVIQMESNGLYKGDMEITVNGGSYTSEKGSTFYEYLYSNIEDTAVKSILINSGTFVSGTAKNVIKVSNEFAKKFTGFIKGGIFTSNPAVYVAVGYKNIINEDSKYEVSQITLPTGTKTISGTITNGVNATVQLKQGGIVLKSLIASDTGKYEFTNVAAGIYNIVATNGFQSVMKVVQMGSENISLDMTVPETGSVSFVVVGSDTPNLIVDGLNTVGDEGDNITLVVALNSEPESEVKNSIEEKVNSKKDVLYLDITLGTNEEFITETEGMLELIVPFDLSKNKDIELYRSHAGVTSKLTALTSKPETPADATYYLDVENNLIHIYANKFSTYAIAYTDINNPKTGDNVLLYITLGVLSLIAISSSIVYMNKRKLVAVK